MANKFCVLFLVVSLACFVSSLKISLLQVPKEVDLNKNDDIILDCGFEIQNMNDSTSLEIKWFYDGAKQIYQWLPGRKEPQVLGILKDRVDLQYKVIDSSNTTKHSALKITNISSDLSGEYMCKVSSFYQEVTASEKMVIYEPAKEFDFILMSDANDTVILVCTASGISPKPIMTISAPGSNVTRLNEEDYDDDDVDDVDNYKVYQINDLYSIKISFQFLKSAVQEETQFVCELRIPDTSYNETRTVTYYPDGEPLPELETEIDFVSTTTVSESSAYSILPSPTQLMTIFTLLATLILL